MYKLANDTLEVSILDPLADRERFGTRYCTGGYIFQISDTSHGDLLSGPTYPDDFDWFNGQGIPDAFNRMPLRDPGNPSSIALVIGIGFCDQDADVVTEFCSWEIQQDETSITMVTSQTHGNYSLELERTVTLHGRTIRSSTILRNTGRQPIPVNWFPHPFYPQPRETDELCRFNIPVTFPDNDGFDISESGFISRKGWPWQGKGHYQALNHNAKSNLVVLQKHPKLGLVATTCSYVPDFFPIWGNTNTFSWEPYYERTVAPNQTLAWWIDYEF
jgi:hypothetical protein